jgi:hypothetical protein
MRVCPQRRLRAASRAGHAPSLGSRDATTNRGVAGLCCLTRNERRAGTISIAGSVEGTAAEVTGLRAACLMRPCLGAEAGERLRSTDGASQGASATRLLREPWDAGSGRSSDQLRWARGPVSRCVSASGAAAAGGSLQRVTPKAIAAAVLRPRTPLGSGPTRGTPSIEANRHETTPAPFGRRMPNIALVYLRVLSPESNSPPPQIPSLAALRTQATGLEAHELSLIQGVPVTSASARLRRK